MDPTEHESEIRGLFQSSLAACEALRIPEAKIVREWWDSFEAIIAKKDEEPRLHDDQGNSDSVV